MMQQKVQPTVSVPDWLEDIANEVMEANDNNVLPIPGWFWKYAAAVLAGKEVQVNYAELANEAASYKKNLAGRGIQISSPARDNRKVALALIDAQRTFAHPNGELYVSGALEDSVRTALMIIMFANIISVIAATLDTHMLIQVFHPKFWVNKAGEHPAPFTQIGSNDVLKGTWVPNPAMLHLFPNTGPVQLIQWAVHYTKSLEDGGQHALMVWPYHGILGGINFALIEIIHAATIWWSLLRDSDVHYEVKGSHRLTEMYGGVEPEVMVAPDGTPIASPQYSLIKVLSEADMVLFAGQAYTHCVWTTAKQLHARFGDAANNATHLLSRLRILKDQSSPVGGFEGLVPTIDSQLENMGFELITTTTPASQW